MKHGLRLLLLIIVISASAAFFSSCAKTQKHSGQVVATAERTAIDSAKGDMRHWGTNDVTISYKLVDEKENLAISGWVEIADSVLYTFPNARFFYLYLYLLDANGRVISRHHLRPFFPSRSAADGKVPFSRRIARDPGTVAIAFSYWGVFEEQSSLFRRGGDSWEIQYNPFRK